MLQPSLTPLSSHVLTSQLDLSGNQLCGLNQWGTGTYTAEGITAIADALKVTASLTSLSLGDNNLGDDGVEALSVGLKESKSLATLDLSNMSPLSTKFGPKGAAALASAIAVMGSITHIGEGGLDLRGNKLGDEGWGAIFAGVCSSEASKVASIDASGEGISPKGAKLIAEALRTSVNSSLTSVWTPAHEPSPQSLPLFSCWQLLCGAPCS